MLRRRVIDGVSAAVKMVESLGRAWARDQQHGDLAFRRKRCWTVSVVKSF